MTVEEKINLIDPESRDNWDKAMTIMKGVALYPNPDWYPSYLFLADMAWERFARDATATNAMLAIEEIMIEGLPIPKELMPWVIKACVSWRKAAGNKREVGKEATDRKYLKAFSDIYDLRMKGLTKVDATEEIAEKTGLSYDTLYATHQYKGGKVFKRVKETLHHRLMGYVMVMIDEGVDEDDGNNREFTKSVISKYPAFFKEKLYMKLYPEHEKYFQDIIDLTD